MWTRLRAAFRKAVTFDAIVGTLVSTGIAAVVVAFVGGFLHFDWPYLAILGGGVFLLGIAVVVAPARVARFEALKSAAAPRKSTVVRQEEPPLPAEPPPEEGAPTWMPLVLISGGLSEQIPLRLESDDGSRLRFFICEVADPSGRWVTGAIDPEENKGLCNLVDIYYPRDFPGGPEIPMEDGPYQVRWSVRRGAGKRLLAEMMFTLREGKVEL